MFGFFVVILQNHQQNKTSIEIRHHTNSFYYFNLRKQNAIYAMADEKKSLFWIYVLRRKSSIPNNI